jgi:hypothetical protein
MVDVRLGFRLELMIGFLVGDNLGFRAADTLGLRLPLKNGFFDDEIAGFRVDGMFMNYLLFAEHFFLCSFYSH